ncbi:MAG: hypothetical protein K0Q72_987 [Armatimonadetes bacterium]|jgi:hypothetical protein|nr:hypothetical protein [Armatimonadota bacterium]
MTSLYSTFGAVALLALTISAGWSQPDLRGTAQWKTAAARFEKSKASAASTLGKADRVEVYRLLRRGNEKAAGKLLGGVPYYSRGKDRSRAFAARLAAVTLDSKSYLLPGQSTKQCYMDPGIGFRLKSGSRLADVIICFQCSELVVLENNPLLPEKTIGSWILGRFIVSGDFDPVRAQLAALAKEALPNVPEIQKL